MIEAVDSGALVVPTPDEATMVELMRLCVAEEVPPEYAASALEDLGLCDRDVHWTHGRPAAADAFRVLVVGAGVSGIVAGIKLRDLGIAFEIVERNPGLGGTWFGNRYPESGVDTPNHFYSYSFAPNPGWSGYFSKQHEVLDYLEGVAERFGLGEHISLGTEVVSMRWDDTDLRWVVHLCGPDGAERVERADAVITATGQMNRPKILPADIDRFRGRLVPLGGVARRRADRRPPGGGGRHRRQRHAARCAPSPTAPPTSRSSSARRSGCGPTPTTTARSRPARSGCSSTCPATRPGTASASTGATATGSCAPCAATPSGPIPSAR